MMCLDLRKTLAIHRPFSRISGRISRTVAGFHPWFGVMLGLVSLTFLTSCSLPQVSASSRLFAPIFLEFIDDYTLPQTVFQDAPVGGLSGLTYDAQKGLFYAISDDRSGFAPARFYTLKPKVDVAKPTGKSTDQSAQSAEKLEIKTIEIKAATTLKQENGQPYARNKIDPEGIALSPRGTVIISSEGTAQEQVDPFVNEYDLATGQWVQSLTIPPAYLPKTNADGTKDGIQENKGFESLTINVDATTDLFRVFTAIEQPLEQDLPPVAQNANKPTQNTPSPKSPAIATPAPAPVATPAEPENPKLRMIHYSLIPNRSDVVGEYVYELDPGGLGTVENGLSDILAIDNAGRFLSLERSLGIMGFNGRIYQFTFAGARDVQLTHSLRNLLAPPVRKKLMLDLSTLGIAIDNVEGMSLGPKLPDGSQSLWIVSDDNFSKDQVTQFLLFRLKPQS